MQVDVAILLMEYVAAKAGMVIFKHHPRTIRKIATVVDRPFFVNGLNTIHINLSTAIRVAAVDDDSTDTIMVDPMTLHRMESFHFTAT
jgi:hypothetical protein